MRFIASNGLAAFALVVMGCSSSTSFREPTHFSRLDSLTDTYLVMHDSLLHSWNRVVKNEMDKASALHELVGILDDTLKLEPDRFMAFQSRIEQLDRIRFTQKTLSNPHVVEEYDHACATLTHELFTMAGRSNKVTDLMRSLEDVQRSSYLHRYQYDSFANNFNAFITTHSSVLVNVEGNRQPEVKPMFWRISSSR